MQLNKYSDKRETHVDFLKWYNEYCKKGMKVMRMIDVLDLQADDDVEFGTKLIVIDEKDEINKFEYTDYNNGTFIDDDGVDIDVYYSLDYNFLNYEVELLEE